VAFVADGIVVVAFVVTAEAFHQFAAYFFSMKEQMQLAIHLQMKPNSSQQMVHLELIVQMKFGLYMMTEQQSQD